MELYHSIQFKRCARSTVFHGEPKGVLHSIQQVCQEHGLLWRAQGSSTIQFRRCARSTAFYGEPKMELYHSIQFKRCARSTAFHGEPKGVLHSIQQVCQEHGLSWRAQGSSAIQFRRCARSTAFYGEPKGALPFNSKGVPGARPSFHDDHHGISQNPFGMVIYLYVCVLDL